jgi:hypothetical protein
VADVLHATDRTAIASFRNSAEKAITTHKFSAIIDNAPGPPLFNPHALHRDYQQCAQLPALLIPVAGHHARPAVVWIPKSVSCQAALSILGGGKAVGA